LKADSFSWKKKNQKELPFRRESVVNAGFLPENEVNLLIKKSYQKQNPSIVVR
jgi:hypothetical protein